MKVEKGNKPKANKTEPEAPKQDGVKTAGVYAEKKGNLIMLELRADNGGIAVGLTVEQCNAVAFSLTTLADEVASDLSAINP